MPADFNRILRAAAQAALEDHASGSGDGSQKKGKGLTAPRAMLIGAGVFTAGRLVMRGRSNGLIDGLQERLARYQDEDAEPVDDDEDFDDEEEFDQDEPYDEAEDEPEDEYDEEPEGEYDDEPEDEYDEEEPEREDEDEEPDEEPSRRARSSR